MSRQKQESWDKFVNWNRESNKINFSDKNEVHDDVSFRKFLEKGFAEHEYYRENVQRLLAHLLPSFQESFLEVVSKFLGPKPVMLIWEACAAVLEAGFYNFQGYRKIRSLNEPVELLYELNVTIPRFDDLPATCNDEYSVRDSLERIVDTYLDSCKFLISWLTEQPKNDVYDPSRNITPRQYIKGTENVIILAKAMFDVAFDEMNEDPNSYTLDFEPQHEDDDRARWTIGKTLGYGANANVHQTEHPWTKAPFAMKKFHADSHRIRVENEVAIMKKLQHVHIATFLCCISDSKTGTLGIIISPLADMHLGQYLSLCEKKLFPQEMTELLQQWMGCLAAALAFAHEKKVKHRDMKPSNILVKGKLIYLSDFGESEDFSKNDISQTANSFHSTHRYAAPELDPSNERPTHGRKTDVFSLGCIYVEMLTIRMEQSLQLFIRRRKKHNNKLDLYYLKLEAVKDWLGYLEDSTNRFLIDITLQMIVENPDERIAAEQIVFRFKNSEDVEGRKALYCTCTDKV